MARVRNDRFGNPTVLVGCKDNKRGYPVGYVTISNKTYKIEPSESKKDGVRLWLRVTELSARQRNNGSFGGGGRGYSNQRSGF